MYAPGGKTPAHSASSGDLFGGETPAHSASGGDVHGGKPFASGGDLPAPISAGLSRVFDSAHFSQSARHHSRSRVPRRPRGGGGRASARQLTVADVMREHPGYCVGSMSSKRAVLPRDKVLHPGGTYYLSKTALAEQGAQEGQRAEGKGAEGKAVEGESTETESAEGQRAKQQSAKQRGVQAANEPAGRGLHVGGTTASSSASPARDGLVEGGGDAQAEEDPGEADHSLLVDILGDSQPENLPQLNTVNAVNSVNPNKAEREHSQHAQSEAAVENQEVEGAPGKRGLRWEEGERREEGAGGEEGVGRGGD
ncbi:unnamed protein product [Closterium sp. Yama58-4]|nr:unnamed protein product [Closterium sp. Yama58-4]